MPPFPVNFMVDSHASEYPQLAAQGLENCFVVPPSKDGRKPAEIRACAGAVSLKDTSDVICRGMIAVTGSSITADVAWVVFEGNAFKITYDGTTFTATNIGSIPGTGPCIMERNSKDPYQVGVITDDGRYFVIDSGDSSIEIVFNADLPSAWNSIAFLNQYMILGVDDGRMFSTALTEAKSINLLHFATAEARPDGLVRVFAVNDQLLAMGKQTIEIWKANGAADAFPFSVLPGGHVQKGLLSKHSVQAFDNAVAFISHDKFVAQMRGGQTQVISNNAVERAISGITDPENITSYTYSQNGNIFYGLRHDDFTWEFNARTGLWHKRESLGRTHWRMTHVAEAFGKIISADAITGNIYELDPDLRTENGDEVVCEAISEGLSSIPGRRRINRFYMDAVTGHALATGTTPQTNPVMMLSYSDDGGAIWASERHLSLGAIGGRRQRVKTTRLGSTDWKVPRIFRIRVSDPHVVAWSKAEVDVG